ncbi:hypothetical protein [Mycobacteroides chelonae]|uniref:hypothetical protein n=1 Tax=Mycobacteroides chelonae TaxID=1774 RepID=UPI0009937F60|nr:hypothetical protein [Mycobacteroides chelonae]
MTQLRLYQNCPICFRLVNTYESAPYRHGHDACGKALLSWNWEAMDDTEDATAVVSTAVANNLAPLLKAETK